MVTLKDVRSSPIINTLYKKAMNIWGDGIHLTMAACIFLCIGFEQGYHDKAGLR